MIGDTLKRIRYIYGMKATEMSDALGISKSYLSEIENNKKVPSIDLLRKYSSVFGIKISSLMLLSEELEDAEKQGKGIMIIRNIMSHLIEQMSENIQKQADEE